MSFSPSVIITAVLLHAWACTGSRTEPVSGVSVHGVTLEKKTTLPFTLRQSALGDETIHGVSGLARSPDGYWFVTDHQHTLGKATVDGKVLKILPLQGVPDDLDTEGVALLSDGRLAIGTESLVVRGSDRIFIAEINDDRVRTVNEIVLDYGHWGIEASPNQGAEALCSVHHQLVVGAEFAIEDGGRSYAPVAVYDLETQLWRYARLQLSTPTGRLSSLACVETPRADLLELVGIERHFGVGRVLRFTFPDLESDIVPEIIFDLAENLDPLPNFEGIEILDNGTLVLVTDNHYGGRVHGPSLWLIAAPKHKS